MGENRDIPDGDGKQCRKKGEGRGRDRNGLREKMLPQDSARHWASLSERN